MNDHDLRSAFATVPAPATLDARWREAATTHYVPPSHPGLRGLATASVLAVLVAGGLVADRLGPEPPLAFTTDLTRHQGDLRMTTPGAVLADTWVLGTVTVEAPDVHLIHIRADAVVQTPAATALTIRDSTLTEPLEISADNATIEHNDLAGLHVAPGVHGLRTEGNRGTS